MRIIDARKTRWVRNGAYCLWKRGGGVCGAEVGMRAQNVAQKTFEEGRGGQVNTWIENDLIM